MLNFDSLELVAEVSIGLKNVAVYRHPDGSCFVHNTMDNKSFEIWPADALTWYHKVSTLQDWAMQRLVKEEEK